MPGRYDIAPYGCCKIDEVPEDFWLELSSGSDRYQLVYNISDRLVKVDVPISLPRQFSVLDCDRKQHELQVTRQGSHVVVEYLRQLGQN